MTIRDRIHRIDPYLGLNPDAYPCEIRGWNDHSDRFRELAGASEGYVLEIGSWLGASAIHLASACPMAHVICVDTWLGSEEMYGDLQDPLRYGSLRVQHGLPTILWCFLANVMRAGLQDRITPFPIPSGIGLRLLRNWGVRPDLIYVDGDHSEASVFEDIRASQSLNPKVLCGDDYHDWPGVRSVVDRLFPTARVDPDGFWWVQG